MRDQPSDLPVSKANVPAPDKRGFSAPDAAVAAFGGGYTVEANGDITTDCNPTGAQGIGLIITHN